MSVLSALPVAVLIGDSLTEFGTQPGGWAAHLQNHYISRRDVLVRGSAGYNSRWLRQVLARTLPQASEDRPYRDVALVTLLVGTNDSVDPLARCGPGWPQQHVPVAEFERNLAAMVEHLVGVRNSDGTSPIVAVMSPPPTDGDAWHRFMLQITGPSADASQDVPQRANAAVQPFADAAGRVVDAQRAEMAAGRRGRLIFIDLYRDMLSDVGDGGWRRFLSDDGVHFSRDGNKFVFDRLSAALTGAEGPVDKLPRQTPHFFEALSAFGDR